MDTGNMRVMHTSHEDHSKKLENLQAGLKASLKRRVSKAREDLRYSQVEMLKHLAMYGLGRTQGSLSQIENGKRLPSVEILYVMAKYLNTSTDYLLGLTHNALSAADIEEDLAAGESAIDRLLKELPPDKQKQVFQFAEYLLSRHTSGRSDTAMKINERQTEQEQINLELEVLLDSIERAHGKAVRDELEKVFRNKGFGVGKAS